MGFIHIFGQNADRKLDITGIMDEYVRIRHNLQKPKTRSKYHWSAQEVAT